MHVKYQFFLLISLRILPVNDEHLHGVQWRRCIVAKQCKCTTSLSQCTASYFCNLPYLVKGEICVQKLIKNTKQFDCQNGCSLSRFDYVTCAWFFIALMYSVISDRSVRLVAVSYTHLTLPTNREV